MKKLFLSLIICIFLVSSVYAFEFDNVKEYDSVTNTITWKNSFLGIPTDDIATGKLLTPQTNYVVPGRNRLVAEIEFNVYDNYPDAIKGMSLYDIKTGNVIQREISYKYRETILEDAPVYEEICVDSKEVNKTTDKYDRECSTKQIGTEKVEKYVWNDYPSKDLSPGKVVLGIFTDVYANDNVEWIGNYFGKDATEWASWSDSYNVGLLVYFDGNSTDNVITSNARINLTNLEGVPIYGSPDNCLIGKCINVTEGKNFKIASNNITNFTGSYTLNFWVRGESNGASGNPYFMGSPTNGKHQLGWDSPTDIMASSDWTGASGNLGTTVGYDKWFMITVTGDGSNNNVSIYVNGTIKRSGTTGTPMQNDLYFGNIFNLIFDWQGQFDEIAYWNRTLSVSEVAGLFNGGAGYTYGATPALPIQSLNVVLPIGNQGLKSVPYNVSLNFSIVGASSSCWYHTAYNFTNVTIPSCVNRSIIISDTQLSNTIYVYANDSYGSINSSSSNFSIYLINSLTYNTTTYDSKMESFAINISGISITNANFIYNGTAYISSIDDNVLSNILVVSGIGNKSFYWNLNNGAINTSIYNQTSLAIPSINVSEICPSGLSPVINFSFFNETNLGVNNVSIKYNLQYGFYNPHASTINGSLNYITSTSICINSSIGNLTLGYGEIAYSSTGFSDRRFYLYNGTLLYPSSRNYNLYSLESASSTSFLFTAQDPQLNAYKGIYLTLGRWYPAQNSYFIVEMAKTDDKGQSIMRSKVEDPDYQVGVYYNNGTLIYLAAAQRFACLASPCSYSILVPSSSSLSLNEYLDLDYNLSYNNNTKVFTLIFSDPSGKTGNIKLDVFKQGGDNSYLICSSNVSSSVGVLTCNVSSWNGILRAVAYRTASPQTPIDTKIISTLASNFSINGGLFISLIIALVLVFIGVASPVLMIIMSVLALIPMIIFGILEWHIFMVVVVMGFIVVYFMRRNNGFA